MNKIVIKPFKEELRKIYAYTLPESKIHENYAKVGQTSRKVETRILEQLQGLGFNPKILFKRKAQKSNGKYFTDRDLHRFYKLNGIKKVVFENPADEWFDFQGDFDYAEKLTDDFINSNYGKVQTSEEKMEYTLRKEQRDAIDKTLEYYYSGKEPREFLWNAKPRFGKTLTTYDFLERIDAQNVLIVTNRPAIANSWYDDFKKFISWKDTGKKFISETEGLKGKAMTREEFILFSKDATAEDKKVSQIVFISLQDLKGAKFAGGEYEKLEWVANINWDVLVIDEAHEGVDTVRTDEAFNKIKRDFTLHLSGTPFKALASNKFNSDQIYNWSYLDEQKAKVNWDYTLGTNPYSNLPTLNLFIYQMSKMIEDEVSQGLRIGEENNLDYAFDLGEFFKTKDNGKFVYEESVDKFLDNLSSGKFPFSEEMHRDELNHTFWLLPSIAACKALEKKLRKHKVFSEYEVVLAAGDGISLEDEDGTFEKNATDYNKNTKSYDKVKKAISENEKTITLSVGQLTTGVTIPEWTGVLMLNNIKSPSLYFQAAFRAQNPYEFEKHGKLYVKENAYVFDFAPDRTLVLYDKFANNLLGNKGQTEEDRKNNIRELINFFPVIGEDEDGSMYKLDATEVLTIPNKIKSVEVVRRGFMSNLLFKNISNIFKAPEELKKILENIPPEKDGRHGKKKKIKVNDVNVDEHGNSKIDKEIVIGTSKGIFGEKIYIDKITDEDIENFNNKKVVNKLLKPVEENFRDFKEKFNLTNRQLNKVKSDLKVTLEGKAMENYILYQEEVKEIESKYEAELEKADTQEDKDNINNKFYEEYDLAKEKFKDILAKEAEEAIENLVESEILRDTKAKQRETEKDVRDHLRGFTRTIPAFLMAYGNENTNLRNFEKNIDEDTFYEVTNITIEQFKMLRDGFEYVDDEGNIKKTDGFFDEIVFNASIKEFFNIKNKLSNYLEDGQEEDIFDYIPPQKNNQIFTPKSVVKRMVDILEEENPNIFKDPNIKFIDLYTKSGLYLTEVIKRLNKGLNDVIPDKNRRIKHILEEQVYGVAPSNIIYNIGKNYIYSGFKNISDKNLVECDLTKYIEDENFKEKLDKLYGGRKLKFDVIIGNPPYHEEDGGAQASARPIYHHFINLAKSLNPKYLSFVIPTRWFVGGKGLDKFREEMLTDKRLKEIHDWLTPEDIFPDTNIRGGVCYFLWDRDYDNENMIELTSYKNNKIISNRKRPLKLDGIDIFIRDNRGIGIMEKVKNYHESNFVSLMEHVSPRRPFNIDSNFINSSDFKESKGGLKDPIICYGKRWTKGYVERELVEVREDWIDKWKVFAARANNIGTELSDDNFNTKIGEPGTICTEAYIAIGADLNLDKDSAKALDKYLQTKFARYLHSLAKASHDATAKTYRFIPLQDFTTNSDIDWSKPIPEIDKQLYEKYNLDHEEIEYIESMIKPIE